VEGGIDQPDIEHINPILLHCLLTAVRRYERELYSHLCRSYHVDADRITGLFHEVEELSPAQLRQVLAELREAPSYQDIVFLAGRNAFHQWCEVTRQCFDRPGGGIKRFRSLLDKALPSFLGLGRHSMMVKGSLQFVEVHNSLFARDEQALLPLCGFYAGFMEELAKNCTSGNASALETRCIACENDDEGCVFEVVID
jgi:hypothetical protein